MSVLMTPDMANFSGNVHGGVLLKLLDVPDRLKGILWAVPERESVSRQSYRTDKTCTATAGVA